MSKLKPNILFGMLSNDGRRVPLSLKRSLRKRMPNSEILPLQVDKKSLQNTLTCMKLIEISGLIIGDEYMSDIQKHLPNLTNEAKKAGLVDLIEKRGKRIIGHNTTDEAISLWSSNNSTSKKRPSLKRLNELVLDIRVDILTSSIKK